VLLRNLRLCRRKLDLPVPKGADARHNHFCVHRFYFVELFVAFRFGDRKNKFPLIHLALRGLNLLLRLRVVLGSEKGCPAVLDFTHRLLLPRILCLIVRHLLRGCQMN
jgi:hypothetical protein